MTDDLDAALAENPPEPETAISTASPRRHRHVWITHAWRGTRPNWLCDFVLYTTPDLGNIRCGLFADSHPATYCRCGAIQDPVKSRQGRQGRNYGNRAELDVARRYGGRKVGHAQGPTDVQGKTRKTQVKTTRRSVPAMWRNEFAKLDSERDGRLAILLLRFIRAGSLGPDDYFVIRAKDFIEWYGRDE